MPIDIEKLEAWLQISSSLLFELRGGVMATDESFGRGLNATDFAALIEREDRRTDHALTQMALCADIEEARFIFAQLGSETLISLHSRWAAYHHQWSRLQEQPQPHWFPADRTTWWRAVLLAMTSEPQHSTEAIRQLWPELF